MHKLSYDFFALVLCGSALFGLNWLDLVLCGSVLVASYSERFSLVLFFSVSFGLVWFGSMWFFSVWFHLDWFGCEG